jgi:hypothetical protein
MKRERRNPFSGFKAQRLALLGQYLPSKSAK